MAIVAPGAWAIVASGVREKDVTRQSEHYSIYIHDCSCCCTEAKKYGDLDYWVIISLFKTGLDGHLSDISCGHYTALSVYNGNGRMFQ